MIIMFQIWFMTGKWQKLTEKKWSISSSRAGFQYSALALGAAAAAAAVSTLKMTWFKFHPLRFSVWLWFGVVWAGPVGAGVTRAAPDLYRQGYPISARGDRLCQPHYYWPPHGFSNLPTTLCAQRIAKQVRACHEVDDDLNAIITHLRYATSYVQHLG